ncbi:MAG: 5'-nucleotidase C-terminal domain-containing protein [Clostridia bacterium]
MFLSISGERRVKDVKILDSASGEYRQIDPKKTYTVASNDFMLKHGGDGINLFMDNAVLKDAFIIDNQVIIDYITNTLKNTIGKAYATAEDRIIIE